MVARVLKQWVSCSINHHILLEAMAGKMWVCSSRNQLKVNSSLLYSHFPVVTFDSELESLENKDAVSAYIAIQTSVGRLAPLFNEHLRRPTMHVTFKRTSTPRSLFKGTDPIRSLHSGIYFRVRMPEIRTRQFISALVVAWWISLYAVISATNILRDLLFRAIFRGS